jgi:DNA adenine methylase
MKYPTSPVDPVSPPAPYLGGKRFLAPTIIARIAEVDHGLYAEPFVGMGGVFFRRDRRPEAEVINDRNGDVVNLFRILQRHYAAFMDHLKFQLTSRREFERLSRTDPATLTDLERAARFLYLQRTAYGGKVHGQSFGVSPERPARFDIAQVGPILEEIYERLTPVIIENLDWLDLIDRYDRPEALFYLDPPYWGNEDDYVPGAFGRPQFALMADRLRGLKGRGILSRDAAPFPPRNVPMVLKRSCAITRDLAAKSTEPVFSEGRGHRFEFCRVHQPFR